MKNTLTKGLAQGLAIWLAAAPLAAHAAHHESSEHHDDKHEHAEKHDHDKHEHADKHDHDKHDHDKHDHEHGAHEHGKSALQIALEGEKLAMSFVSANWHLIGFEHAPENDEHQAAINALEASLGKPESWLALPASANCTLSEQNINIAGPKQNYKDTEAEWHYQCTQPDQLDTLEIRINRVLSGIETLEVQAISDLRQHALELGQGEVGRIHLR